MKRIKTNGRSNEDIANQIAKQIDGLALTSSDDILKSMLDRSKDKESLIKQLLTTRLGNDEAIVLPKIVKPKLVEFSNRRTIKTSF